MKIIHEMAVWQPDEAKRFKQSVLRSIRASRALRVLPANQNQRTLNWQALAFWGAYIPFMAWLTITAIHYAVVLSGVN